jgi:thioesterase domain-containing protein
MIFLTGPHDARYGLARAAAELQEWIDKPLNCVRCGLHMISNVVNRSRHSINRGAGNARIVPLKLGRPGPCLFLVPGTGGQTDGFANLAASLHIDMPVFAIEARGIDESSDPDTSVQEMARHYLTRVKTVQAAGPFFLGGHSFGGLVALEMALCLIEAKERVGCLILLDCVVPTRCWPLRFYLSNLIRVRARRHIIRISTHPVTENLKYYFRRLLFRMYGSRMPGDLKIGNNVARVMIGSEIARKRYNPSFYPDKLTLFCSSEWESEGYERLWHNRVRELEVHSAAGNHMSIIYPPNVSSLAAEISVCLMKALAATTPAPSFPLDA